MRQLSIGACYGRPDPKVAVSDGSLPVYDFFCGGGGFSMGAEMAGCTVVYATDADEDALEMHRRNHPNAKHACLTLPRDAAQIPWPTDGSPFHAHFSPPCQAFSKQGNPRVRDPKKRKRESVQCSTEMLKWSLDAALRCGATSWSLEEVAMPKVMEMLESYRAANHTRMAFSVVELCELGVPQTRTRVLAGSPALIAAMLRRRGEAPAPTIRETLPAPRGSYIHTGTGVRKADPHSWGRHLYPLYGLAPTVMADGALWWINFSRGGMPEKTIVTPREAAALQTFPETTKLPENKKLARRLVGNAVPPRAAAVLMRGARD